VFAACANEDISVEWVGGIHATGHASFGAQSAHANLHMMVVHAEPADGCSGITNGDAVAGNIALIQRGACTFVEKVLNAQNMGAAAVIVYNNRDGNNHITMGGDDDGHNILAVFISENDGNALAAAVAEGTTTVSLSCQACDTGRKPFPLTHILGGRQLCLSLDPFAVPFQKAASLPDIPI
jgi:hypothetical protein